MKKYAVSKCFSRHEVASCETVEVYNEHALYIHACSQPDDITGYPVMKFLLKRAEKLQKFSVEKC